MRFPTGPQAPPQGDRKPVIRIWQVTRFFTSLSLIHPSYTAPLGVHIQVIRDVLAKARQANLPPKFTTNDVCEAVIKPATAARHCAYIDVLRDDSSQGAANEVSQSADEARRHQPPLFGAATHFISHAWKFEFELVVAVLEEMVAEAEAGTSRTPAVRATSTSSARAPSSSVSSQSSHGSPLLESKEAPAPTPTKDSHALPVATKPHGKPIYLWFDLIINNQHTVVDRPFDWWCHTFRDSIQRIGHLVLILAPFHDPLPLKRAWCLWEVFSAVSADVDFDIWLPRKEEQALRRALAEDYHAVLGTLIRIQAERAEAGQPQDRSNIFAAISSSCGFTALNKTVKDRIRHWLHAKAVEMAEKLQEEDANSTEAAWIIHNVAGSLHDVGDNKRAVPLFQRAIAIFKAHNGQHSDIVAMATNNLGAALRMQGKNEEALECFRQAADTASQHFEDDDPRLITLWDNMAVAQAALGHKEEALAAHQRVLDIRLKTLGEDHEDAVASLTNVAAVYKDLGQAQKALDMLGRALKAAMHLYGKKHPSLAHIYGNQAAVLADLGDLELAAARYSKALKILAVTVGERHEETRAVCDALSKVTDRLEQKHSTDKAADDTLKTSSE